MKSKVVLATLLIAPLMFTACAKKNDAPSSEQGQSASQEQKTTPEQQAAINAIDKPVMDEKNTDIPESVSNAPADVATPHEEQK